MGNKKIVQRKRNKMIFKHIKTISLTVSEIQIKSSLRYNFILNTLSKLQNLKKKNSKIIDHMMYLWRCGKTRFSVHCWWE